MENNIKEWNGRCKYRPSGVDCFGLNRNCENCGWNPQEERRRIIKSRRERDKCDEDM